MPTNHEPFELESTRVIARLRQTNKELERTITELELRHAHELALRDVTIAELDVKIAELRVKARSGLPGTLERAEARLKTAQAARQTTWIAWRDFQEARPR